MEGRRRLLGDPPYGEGPIYGRGVRHILTPAAKSIWRGSAAREGGSQGPPGWLPFSSPSPNGKNIFTLPKHKLGDCDENRAMRQKKIGQNLPPVGIQALLVDQNWEANFFDFCYFRSRIILHKRGLSRGVKI